MAQLDDFGDKLENVLVTQEYLNLNFIFIEQNSLLSIYIR